MLKGFKAAMMALFLAGIWSCVEDVKINFGSEEAVAVDCVLRNQATQVLRLYKLKEVYGVDARAIEDAAVTLLAYDEESGDYSAVAEFHHYDGVEWRAEYEPEHGVRYKLSVIIPGKEEITAETRFPEDLRLISCSSVGDLPIPENCSPTVDSLDSLHCRIIYYEVRKANMVWSYDSNFKYEDGKEVQFRDYHELFTDSCKMWIFPHVDAEQDYGDHPDNMGLENYLYPELYDFKGHSRPYAKLVATDHPYVDDLNITQGTVYDLNWCNLPLDVAPPLFVDGRIYAHLRQWPLVICPGLPLHDAFLRISHPADFVNRKNEPEGIIKPAIDIHSFYIIADYSESFGLVTWTGRSYFSCLLETHFVSEEYDSYLKDVYTSKGSVDDFILSAYEVKHIYSNIKGGYGIFGADNVTWDQYEVMPFDYAP